MKYLDILKNNRVFDTTLKGKPLTIKILSNITCNQFAELLKFNLGQATVPTSITLGNYDNIVQDSFLTSNEEVVIIHYDIENILDKSSIYVEDMSSIQLNVLYEAIVKELTIVSENLKNKKLVIYSKFFSSLSPSTVINTSNLRSLVNRLNLFLSNIAFSNVFLVDLDIVLSRYGLSASVNSKMFIMSKTLYTTWFWDAYILQIEAQLLKTVGKLKKAIIFDCDNTLWRGILGEDGFGGIDMSNDSKLGHVYNKIQQKALWLSHEGIIIGLCSKNNPDDVEEVLEKHKDMVLRNETIVTKRVNWNDKASNIKEMASSLNIGLDSILYVDDSSFEINLIKNQLPEVYCLQVPASIDEYNSTFLELVNRFFYLSGLKEDREKTLQYKQQAKRNEVLHSSNTFEDFLASLHIEIRCDKNNQDHVERIAQLTQKTNQFNLSTKRYTEKDINDYISGANSDVYTFNIRDKFGDSGLTVLMIFLMENDDVVLDSFLMSCRVMGRNIEKAICDYCIDFLKKNGIKTLRFTCTFTPKNKPFQAFCKEVFGNPFVETEEYSNYSILLSEYNYQNIKYINFK